MKITILYREVVVRGLSNNNHDDLKALERYTISETLLYEGVLEPHIVEFCILNCHFLSCIETFFSCRFLHIFIYIVACKHELTHFIYNHERRLLNLKNSRFSGLTLGNVYITTQ